MSPADEAASEGSLLETKFYVPRPRDGLVERERLVRRLEASRAARLILVSAPPGFGKSTLLAQWIARAEGGGRSVAWVSLDEGDNSPVRFWTYVLEALSRAHPGGFDSTLAMTQAGQPTARQVLAHLINELGRLEGSLVLVLDDFHLISSPEVQGELEFLIGHCPPNFQVVLSSRTDPAFPLARLRARGELSEIRARDLRMTPEETIAFFRDSMGLDLTQAEVSLLEARTEGWLAALHLAGLSLQAHDDRGELISGFSGDDRYIVDYFVEEILGQLDGEVRDFLLQTSILDRLNASLCDAVTLRTDGKALLETLERRNLFLVPLDDRREWFRYHHLFADVLRAHLEERDPGAGVVLHRRASDWYGARGYPDAAIQHAAAAGDYGRMASVAEREAERVVRHHHPDKLIEWLRPLPEELVRARPVLCMYYGHALQGVGEMESSARWLDLAEHGRAAIEREASPDAETVRVLRSQVALARGYLAMAAGDIEATVAHANTALPLLTEDEAHWRGTGVALLGLAHWGEGNLDAAQEFHAEAVANFEKAGDTGLAITSGYHDAELLKARGRLEAARQRCEASIHFVERQKGAVFRGVANLHLGLSEICSERNDPEGAARELAEAERLGVYPPRTPFRHCLANARLRQTLGDFPGALEYLDEAERLQVRGAVPDYRPVAAWKARIWIAQGKYGKAQGWVRERGLAPDDEVTYRREYEHITLARLLLAGAPTEVRKAEALLRRLLPAAEAGGRGGAAIEIRVLLARALAAEGREPEALDVLGEALGAAEPEGYCRVFLDEGEPVVGLIELAAASGITADYCGRLLAAARTAAPEPEHSDSEAPDALSEREREVLRWLASDLSGPDIAGALFISLNTLRTHTKNIYAKLGATTRREALRRASEAGLIALPVR